MSPRGKERWAEKRGYLMRRSYALALACALLPAGALAAPTGQVQALHQQIAALQLDHALNLTQQQAKSLLPIVQEARSKIQAVKSQLAASEPARVAALTQAVTDLKNNGAVSESTIQALQAARPAPGTLRDDLRPLWQQGRQILTPDQLNALHAVRLGVAAPASGANGGTGPRMGHRGARRFAIMRTVLSDDFLALLQARAG